MRVHQPWCQKHCWQLLILESKSKLAFVYAYWLQYVKKSSKIDYKFQTTARFVEDETRNAEWNGNRNPEWWGDFSQLQVQIQEKSQFQFVPQGTSEFKSNQNLNSTLYSEIPRNLIFSILTSWLKSPHHSGFHIPFKSAFRVLSSTERAVPAKIWNPINEHFAITAICSFSWYKNTVQLTGWTWTPRKPNQRDLGFKNVMTDFPPLFLNRLILKVGTTEWYIKRVLRHLSLVFLIDSYVALAQWRRARELTNLLIRRSQVRFRPKARQLRSTWIGVNRLSSKGSALLLPVIKEN